LTTITHILPSLNERKIELDRFLQSLARARTSALLLDYDGTLSPFCLDRDAAFPYGNVGSLLQQIMAGGRTRVVIVTGRDAQEMVPLLGMNPVPEIWGSHGLQRLRPDGTCEMPFIDADAAFALRRAGQWLAGEGLDNATEFKPGGIAVHWRGQSRSRSAEMRERVLRGWFPIAQEALLSILEFDGGVEIRVPDLDKGDAVRTVVSEIDPAAPVAYLGDDVTDERAFRALGSRGLSILVRPEWRTTSARVWLRPPDELLEFLNQWLQVCTAGTASTGSTSGDL